MKIKLDSLNESAKSFFDSGRVFAILNVGVSRESNAEQSVVETTPLLFYRGDSEVMVAVVSEIMQLAYKTYEQIYSGCEDKVTVQLPGNLYVKVDIERMRVDSVLRTFDNYVECSARCGYRFSYRVNTDGSLIYGTTYGSEHIESEYNLDEKCTDGCAVSGAVSNMLKFSVDMKDLETCFKGFFALGNKFDVYLVDTDCVDEPSLGSRRVDILFMRQKEEGTALAFSVGELYNIIETAMKQESFDSKGRETLWVNLLDTCCLEVDMTEKRITDVQVYNPHQLVAFVLKSEFSLPLSFTGVYKQNGEVSLERKDWDIFLSNAPTQSLAFDEGLMNGEVNGAWNIDVEMGENEGGNITVADHSEFGDLVEESVYVDDDETIHHEKHYVKKTKSRAGVFMFGVGLISMIASVATIAVSSYFKGDK